METQKARTEHLSGEELIEAAKLIIRGQVEDLKLTESLANQLRAENKTAYAAELYYRLLDKAANNPKWRQRLAMCLYKDPDLPASLKLNAALTQLALTIPMEHYIYPPFEQVLKNLDQITSSDFLGVTGAVFKRRWLVDNQYQNLLFAEHFYRKGMECWQQVQPNGREPVSYENDAGYCAINYAFLLELLSFVRFKQTEVLDFTAALQAVAHTLAEAQQIRHNIISALLGKASTEITGDIAQHPALIVNKYNLTWADATLADAFFGLGDYKNAEQYYSRYRKKVEEEWAGKSTKKNFDTAKEEAYLYQVNVDWKLKTTAEQLLWLTDIKTQLLAPNAVDEREALRQGAKACLRSLFPNIFPQGSVITDLQLTGKVGLALSGGGFRASFFHIGVLAKLAELDILRHIEVLSCVSGGSIVGAHYYLLLKKRMEDPHKPPMTKADYVDLVQVVEEDFLRGVQANLRMRIFANPVKNLRIFFDKTYTRTDRLAELYEEHLYAKAHGVPADESIFMHTLRITPAHSANQAPLPFNPKTDNWSQSNKVPMLVLNATSLNTGHNWQFTVSWMGEPPGSIRPDVDMKKRLRRMYYEQAPVPFKNNIRLGHAVGASSCVPVLFEPFMLKGLYPGIDLQLVDGGVHDNQGATSLLEQECKVMIVSDASGQLTDSDTASGNAASVFIRTDSIFQARIRESQVMDLQAREGATQLKALAFVHLKKGLYQYPVNWTDSEEPTRRILRPPMASPDEDLTSYGILYKVQDALAGIRTDLDAFNDAEAYALMYSGYRQIEEELKQEKFAFLFTEPETPEEPEQAGMPETPDFKFKKIAGAMTIPAQSRDLLKRLSLGQQMVGKVFSISWPATISAVIILLAILIPLVWWYWPQIIGMEWMVNWQTIGSWLLPTVLVAFIAARLGAWFSKMLSWENTLLRYLVLGVGAFVLAFFSWLYIRFLNPIYLKFGQLDQLGKRDRLREFWTRVLDFL